MKVLRLPVVRRLKLEPAVVDAAAGFGFVSLIHVYIVATEWAMVKG